jgi:hypothetical protein
MTADAMNKFVYTPSLEDDQLRDEETLMKKGVLHLFYKIKAVEATLRHMQK